MISNLIVGVGVCAAYAASELELFDNEPPIIKYLLECAIVLMGDADNVDSAWKATNLYLKWHIMSVQKAFLA